MERKKQIFLGIGGIVAFELLIPHIKRYMVNIYSDESKGIKRTLHPPLIGLESLFKQIHFDFYKMTGIKWKGYLFGFSYDDYWVDQAGYQLSQNKFEEVIKTTHELHNMCLEATDIAISSDFILQTVFNIPKDMIPMIRQSWKRKQPDLLARYDFIMNKEGELLFLEVNGDTPSCVIEAGPAQRNWAQQMGLFQFNTVEQNIIDGFQRILKRYNKTQLVMFQNDNQEDECTIQYLYSLINQELNANIELTSISWFCEKLNYYLSNKYQNGEQINEDHNNNQILWRQYPLEWLASEQPRKYFTDPRIYYEQSQIMIEPPWKIVMSNKGMSVLLKQLYPENIHLIESSLAPLSPEKVQLSKQKYGREGEGILFSSSYSGFIGDAKDYFTNFLVDSYFNFTDLPIFQAFQESDLHKNRYLTISSWVIHGKPSGILLREDMNPIIGTGSSVVPYYIQKNTEDDTPIEIELQNTIMQEKIRKALYLEQNFTSNDQLIQIKERTTFINNQFNINEIKQNLNDQYQQSNMFIENLKPIHDNLVSSFRPQIFLKNKNNPKLSGFQDYKDDEDDQHSIKGLERSGHTGGGGGGAGGQTTTKSVKSKVQPYRSAGSTGRTYSSSS